MIERVQRALTSTLNSCLPDRGCWALTEEVDLLGGPASVLAMVSWSHMVFEHPIVGPTQGKELVA